VRRTSAAVVSTLRAASCSRTRICSLYTESSGRFLMSALLVGDEFRISQHEAFAKVRPAQCAAQGDWRLGHGVDDSLQCALTR
jgi:hypothetical protein